MHDVIEFGKCKKKKKFYSKLLKVDFLCLFLFLFSFLKIQKKNLKSSFLLFILIHCGTKNQCKPRQAMNKKDIYSGIHGKGIIRGNDRSHMTDFFLGFIYKIIILKMNYKNLLLPKFHPLLFSSLNTSICQTVCDLQLSPNN